VCRAWTTLPLGLAVALALAAAGCGSDEATTEPVPAPETPQALPKLPKRWDAHGDRSIGYRIGIPPGWQVSRSRTGRFKAALIRSPDHLVAVTLVAARDPESLEVPLDEFATSALAALPGFETQLEPSTPRPFRRTPFAAVQTVATGTTKARGVKERTTLIVLRREGIVNYTVAIVENARLSRSAKDRAVALKMTHTLRDQPVGPPAPAKSP
jgi:hypothetical protein